jgi:glutamate synthase (ferredoxin)
MTPKALTLTDQAQSGLPLKQGLYDPQFEHDACGVGFVVNIHHKKSHEIVQQALTMLRNLDHRGACGCEPNTGDGAGILLQIPHKFLSAKAQEAGFNLPAPGEYGVGMIFLPRKKDLAAAFKEKLNAIVKEEGQEVLGWRDVPTNDSTLGPSAVRTEPHVAQIFVGKKKLSGTDDLAFERKLYVIRKLSENAIRYGGGESAGSFYISSFSSRTIVYKGQLTTTQVNEFYPELDDPTVETALALAHSRFSTNTFPSWERAHPNRYIAHNGEINTLRGNVNWMNTRQAQSECALFGDDLKRILPIVNQDGSDSAMLDNTFEMLVLSGRSLQHAMMMLIPEPWAGHESMSDEKKAFYEYHSCLMEPWDGPASIAFTDGIHIGAVLDRNGLRPSRYYVTKDGLVVMASEAGVIDIAPERVAEKGRLQPGRMFLVDTKQGRIISDEEIKSAVVNEKPYRKWLDENLKHIDDLPEAPASAIPVEEGPLVVRQQAFGYTYEELRLLMAPMAASGIEATGSMGADTPLAVLSDKTRPLYDYFQQTFAQVTNPPIDSIREEIVTSPIINLGSEGNLLDPQPENARAIRLDRPILTNEDLAKIRSIADPIYRSVTIPILFDPRGGETALKAAIDGVFRAADEAIEKGYNIVILSDRGVSAHLAPIPALLVSAGLHHHLIRTGTRTRIGMILESGEPREVHHFAVLMGYGVGAINPYLAFESLDGLIDDGIVTGVDYHQAEKNFVKAAVKGVVKVASKMGISTLQSYCGAQIFEAIGLKQSLIEKFFTNTISRVEGIGLDVIAQDTLDNHGRAFDERTEDLALNPGGQYKWRADGEFHLFSPQSIHKLQSAVRSGKYEVFKEYSELINNQSAHLATLRGLLDFKKDCKSIPIDEVETVESILTRFKTGAMSFGSISNEAHEALAIAMNRIGGKSNTGEGGEDPDRFIPLPNGDSKCSAIKQVASGRFGVTSHYLVNAREIQIKMAQGAKPGEGGQLPGPKVYPWVAKVRHATPGVGLISPPPHHDIYSIEDLAELIHDLKNANRDARISVKLVSESGVGTIAAGVSKAHADVVLISGYDGGTGASPQTSIKHAGMPWEIGLAETHQTLVLNNLRSRIRVETDGQLKTGRDVVIAALLGAEEFGFATAALVSLGCVMMRACQLNTCPVGVATQNPVLRERFKGSPDHVVNFMKFVAEQTREIMAELGFKTIDEMVGRVDRLEVKSAIDHWKAKGLDFSAILYQPEVGEDVGRYCTDAQDHGLDKALDITDLLKLCEPAVKEGKPVTATLPIKNTNRVVGTIVGSEISKRYGADGLPEDTIDLTFIGSAGQSFGAFVPNGMTLRIEGDANDYVGKGLSGGKIIVKPPKEATFDPEKNIIIGNVALYGATTGEAYFYGVAGERFAVRNSGVNAVVESVGDHGCEYMTGGKVVILGSTGRNFAAGMSGGIAYVLDENGAFPVRCNKEMVELSSLTDPEEIRDLKSMIERHVAYTGSKKGASVLTHWDEYLPKFVKVMPKDYKRMLEQISAVLASGLSGDEALLAAFEANAKDVSRVGGK